LCGVNNHTDENVKVISLKQAVGLDKTLNELYEMPTGVCVDRNEIGAEWIPSKL